MKLSGKIWLALLLAAMVWLGGCKKKPKTAPPPQAQPPSVIIAPPEAAPPPAPEQKPEPATPAPEAAQPAVTKPKPKPKPKPKVATTAPAKKPAAPAATATNTTTTTAPPKQKTVVPEGGSTNAGQQLSPGISNDQAMHQRQNTAQLLDSTDANLKSVTRALSSDEQAIVQQIRNYMQQSRAATTDGDIERAYNLAMKAHLLSDELVKR